MMSTDGCALTSLYKKKFKPIALDQTTSFQLMVINAALQFNAISVIRQLPKTLILSYVIATILKTGSHIGIQLTQLSSSKDTFILMFGSLTHFCSFKFYSKNVIFAFDELAILKSGSHLGFSAGNRTFLRKYILDIICAKFGACITK